MTEPTILCPKCQIEIKLTESLAAPLIESTRREYEKRLYKKDEEIARREAALHEREEELSKAKETIDDQVAEKLKFERGKIAVEEAKKARLVLATDLDQKTKEITDLQEILQQREEKLAEAQSAPTEPPS